MITITVIGVPKPQGSKRFVGTSKSGRGILVESCSGVKDWRQAVVWAAREHGGKLAGAVDVDLFFTLPKPKSAKRAAVPERKPDIDKLCRSTLDALVMAGTIEDDARVLCMVARKMYANDTGALDVPGAVIRVTGAIR